MTITDTGTRIDCSYPDSLHRRNSIAKECYLMLYPEHIEYKAVADYESDEVNDLEGIWTEVTSNYRWTRARRLLSEVSMYYDNPEKKWMVTIEFEGVSQQTGWLYDSPKDALKIYTQLQDYFLGRI